MRTKTTKIAGAVAMFVVAHLHSAASAKAESRALSDCSVPAASDRGASVQCENLVGSVHFGRAPETPEALIVSAIQVVQGMFGGPIQQEPASVKVGTANQPGLKLTAMKKDAPTSPAALGYAFTRAEANGKFRVATCFAESESDLKKCDSLLLLLAGVNAEDLIKLSRRPPPPPRIGKRLLAVPAGCDVLASTNAQAHIRCKEAEFSWSRLPASRTYGAAIVEELAADSKKSLKAPIEERAMPCKVERKRGICREVVSGPPGMQVVAWVGAGRIDSKTPVLTRCSFVRRASKPHAVCNGVIAPAK